MFIRFMKKIEIALQNQNASIKNLETQVGQLAISMTDRAPGPLPSNTEVNLSEHAKVITTTQGCNYPKYMLRDQLQMT